MGYGEISRRAALGGTAPTHKAMGRVLFTVRKTAATCHL